MVRVGFIDLLSLVTAVLLLAFSVFLFTSGKKKADRWFLGFFLLANAFLLASFFMQKNADQYFELSSLIVFGFSCGYLFGPLLYFYTRSLTVHGFRWQPSDPFFFFPFLLYTGLTIYGFHFESEDLKVHLLQTGFLPDSARPFAMPVLHLFTVFCLVLTANTILTWRIRLKQKFSSTDGMTLSWLLLVVVAFTGMWLLDFTAWMLNRLQTGSPAVFTTLLWLSIGINFLFANLLIQKGLRHRPVQATLLDEQAKPRYGTSLLTESEKTDYLQRIQKCMRDKKPYLNPTLTLNDLADQSGILPKYLSQVINEKLNRNFYDYINGFRVESLITLLSDPAQAHRTVLDLAFESGFNSKTVFNASFRKMTGKTPTEFRKSLQTKSPKAA